MNIDKPKYLNAKSLVALREKRGITQVKLAKMIGRSERQCQRYEAGTVIPEIVQIAIVSVLGE